MLLTAALAFLPACQQGFQNEIIEDQDRQIAGYKAKANRSQSELDLAKARRLELEEQLAFEQDRVNSLEGRLQAMEASAQEADAEVDRLRGQLAGTGVGVERRGDVLVLNLPTNLTFSSGSATLNAKGKSSLKTVAAALKADYDGKTFWVEGHTDNEKLVKTKDKWKTNLRLSVERAMAVADFLSGDVGIAADAIRIAGHGPFDPTAPNTTADNKAKNRRVEILILN
ncbi:MAG: OmpA family protein [Planctomycetes bacterium]|nr:OmpA family protein [Planctomycetota bacterium]